MKLLAIADSDSYLKWAAALVGTLPEHWHAELAVIRSPITPSHEQRTSAVSGTGRPTPQVLSARGLRALVRDHDPDAVLLACTGPVVRILAGTVTRDRRRLLVTGLPGISVPANRKAWKFRAAADLFVVHSEREVAEYSAVGERLELPGRVVMATLPFLGGPAPEGLKDRVVFATQAKVPRLRGEREAILLALAELARSRPDLDVVVKLRARDGEEQTHRELLHYETMWKAMPVDHDLLTFDAGPMHAQLAHAAGFVTVSSTAALEAVAAGTPTLVIGDFGVSAGLINLVFEGSGLIGTLGELAAGKFREPSPEWCAANYFHPAAENTWVAALDELAAAPLPPLAVEPPRTLSRASMRVELPPVVFKSVQQMRKRIPRRPRNTTAL